MEIVAAAPPRNLAATPRLSWNILRLAKEYVIDFDLANAAARCDMDMGRAKTLFKHNLFKSSVQEIIETIEPDIVMKRQEILMALKREAFNHGPDASSSSRVSALKELSRLLGHDPETKSKDGGGAPVINITLTQATPPKVEMTVAPHVET